jgi:hypothetical protein
VILVVEREARDEHGIRLADGVLNRIPELVIADRAPVLIVEREPDRVCPEHRAGASILVAARSGRFPRKLEAKTTIPRTRRPSRIRVAGEDGDQ